MGAARKIVSGTDPALLITGVVAGVVFWIAYDNGSYSLSSRGTLAVAVWWAVILGIVLQLLPTSPLPPSTIALGGLVVAIAYWTLASVLWAPSAEDAFNEFNRVSLYLGVYVLVVLAGTRRTVGRWADALAVAIAAVALVALTSRLLPEVIHDDRELATFLPGAATRLSFPLGYWNGLAIFVGLGVPLLLRLALVARSPILRGVALAPIPAIAAVIYLASSRGGVVTAFVGTLTFLLLTEPRWNAAAAITVAGVGSVTAIAVLLDRTTLVNGPLGTDIANDQGETAAILIGLVCIGVAGVFGLGCRALGERIRPGPTVGRVAAGVAALALCAGIVASDPVQRFETFKAAPGELEALDSGDFVTAHLLSGSGSGRWQFWSSAIDQARENLVIGDGAGSYEHWWAEHASFTYFLKDTHSLYLEMFGELGIVGFILVLTLALAGVAVGVRRSLRSTGEARVTVAALTSVVVAFACAAGVDWIWELAAVSVVGLVALGLVSGPATDVYEPLRSARPGESARWMTRPRFGLGILTVLMAWLLIFAQVIPLLADREVARSQAAAADSDLDESLDAAESARDIQPWAATPYLQLALVSELQGDNARARAWIEEAIELDARDWQLWLVSARLETKLGNVEAAERSLRRAAVLNRRSPLFIGILEDEAAPSD